MKILEIVVNPNYVEKFVSLLMTCRYTDIEKVKKNCLGLIEFTVSDQCSTIHLLHEIMNKGFKQQEILIKFY